MIYLDNNATTIMPTEVKKEMVKWCNRGNPSAEYVTAVESRTMMDNFRKYILHVLGLKNKEEYKVIFTSGGSESNSMILQSAVRAFSRVSADKNIRPHVIITSWEHKSLMLCADSLKEDNLIELTLIQPHRGIIRPEDIQAALKPTTALVCCMAANNETGAIADIETIGKICHKVNVPFHCDAVQSVMKTQLNYAHCDSIAISFHKMHGPPGNGAIIIKSAWLAGWKLSPLIYGTQNGGYRGGTENVMGLAASFVAMKLSEVNRAEKNKEIKRLKVSMLKSLGEKIPIRSYHKSAEKPAGGKTEKLRPAAEIVVFDTPNDLVNTVLLSFVRYANPFCNQSIKKALEKDGIIVSVGSACNTSSSKASHVIDALGLSLNDKTNDPDKEKELIAIRKGILRISLGDETTPADIKKFVSSITKYLKNA